MLMFHSLFTFSTLIYANKYEYLYMNSNKIIYSNKLPIDSGFHSTCHIISKYQVKYKNTNNIRLCIFIHSYPILLLHWMAEQTLQAVIIFERIFEYFTHSFAKIPIVFKHVHPKNAWSKKSYETFLAARTKGSW